MSGRGLTDPPISVEGQNPGNRATESLGPSCGRVAGPPEKRKVGEGIELKKEEQKEKKQ